MELSAIWVVVIVLIGIAIGVYSICKGCQGLREQSAQAIAHLQERTVSRGLSNAHQRNANDSNLFHISGSSVHDKNPPNYDEIMEPPPSYEETIKLHGAYAAQLSTEAAAQVNFACTGCEDEGAACSTHTPATSDSQSPSSSHTTDSQSPSSSHSSTSCTVTIES